MRDQFVLELLAKSDGEVEVNGQPGVVMAGYATKFQVPDKEDERMLEGSLNDLPDTWGRNPVIRWHHGLDPVIGMRQIGTAIEWVVDKVGLFVKVFVPRNVSDDWNDPAAKLRFKDIYAGIKGGRIRGFSIAGLFLKASKDVVKMSMQELSITKRPCHPEALGTVLRGEMATKAMSEVDDGDEELGDQEDLGILPRDSWGGVMYAAQKYGDRSLHDYLLSREAHFQGNHNPEDCPICTDLRATWYGVKADTSDSAYGGFLVTDSTGTKHLPTEKNGKVSRRLLGAAHAALTTGFRGKKYAGPNKNEALAKLKKLYADQGMTWNEADGKSDPGVKTERDILLTEFANRYKEKIDILCLGAKSGAKHSVETRKLIQDTVDSLKGYFLTNE